MKVPEINVYKNTPDCKGFMEWIIVNHRYMLGLWTQLVGLKIWLWDCASLAFLSFPASAKWWALFLYGVTVRFNEILRTKLLAQSCLLGSAQWFSMVVLVLKAFRKKLVWERKVSTLWDVLWVPLAFWNIRWQRWERTWGSDHWTGQLWLPHSECKELRPFLSHLCWRVNFNVSSSTWEAKGQSLTALSLLPLFAITTSALLYS